MRCIRFSLLVLAIALAASPAAMALTYEPAADTALTDLAALVVHAEVLDAQVREVGGRIVTDYAVAALELLKGESVSSVLTVRALGGQLDGRGLLVPGVPRFAQGEELLLFLVPHGDVFRVLHIAQGAFFSAFYGGERYWLRALDEAAAVPTKHALEVPVNAARHADRFTAWIADRAAGVERAADYAVAGVPPLAELRPRAKFTLLDEDDPIRWFEFDARRTLTWFRHAEGQQGVGDGGLAAFSKARQAWNREPNTPVRLIDGGTTGSTTGFDSSDRRNTILFRDIPDSIDTPFDCGPGGGPLAVGGISFVLANERRSWKGRRFRVAFEAEIIVNDGIQCRLRGEPLLLEQIYAHELGHTLGLGHSCGDDASPPCAGNPRFAEALMAATASPPFAGAVLMPDDIDGIRFLYDPDDTPCPVPVGHPRRCTDCGPCGNGEGDCDNDGECRAGLRCVDNVGADFGFPPGIDVCRDGGQPPPPPPPPPPCADLQAGHPKFCDADQCGPCSAGQGDCDRDSDCLPGLVCADNVGADFGFNPGIDVCVRDDGPCTVPPGKRFFCATCGPCGAGEGDCDSDADCRAGLTCVEDVGAQHGFGAKVDVCL